VLRKQFGRRLKQLRKRKKFSQEQFAEMVEVAPYTVSRWETARDAPEFDRLEKIAEALDIPVKDLFDFSKDSP
jgi:transcriptional regulator with XRE-family HTH domain